MHIFSDKSWGNMTATTLNIMSIREQGVSVSSCSLSLFGLPADD